MNRKSFKASDPKPVTELATREPLEMEGHAFSEADIQLLLANASATLRSMEYDVFRLWTLLLKTDRTTADYRLLVTILRTRGANPLYPDPTWARVVPRP